MAESSSVFFKRFAWLLLFSAGAAQAQPKIDGLSGAMAWDQEVRIVGSGFGGGVPSTTDDFESGAFSSAWANHYDLDVNNSQHRHPLSKFSAHLNFRSGADEGKIEAAAAPVSTAWAASYWVYIDPNWDWGTSTFTGTSKFLSNIKIFRLWSPSSINENFVVATQGWENRAIFNMENIAIDKVTTPCMPAMRSFLTLGEWHHFEFEFREDSAPGMADGGFWMSVGGKIWMRRGIVTREDFPHLKRIFIIGWSNVWGAGEGTPDASDDAPNDFYMDDLYVSPAPGRVVVGDAPTFDACKRREWMPVTKWGGQSIDFRYRVPPDFPRPAYLYVIGEGGILGDDLSAGVLLFDLVKSPSRFRIRAGL